MDLIDDKIAGSEHAFTMRCAVDDVDQPVAFKAPDGPAHPAGKRSRVLPAVCGEPLQESPLQIPIPSVKSRKVGLVLAKRLTV
jgi:hypothetical protein